MWVRQTQSLAGNFYFTWEMLHHLLQLLRRLWNCQSYLWQNELHSECPQSKIFHEGQARNRWDNRKKARSDMNETKKWDTSWSLTYIKYGSCTYRQEDKVKW